MIRPWRVGLLVDTTDARAVRGAIADLSSVWGGASMPIFDVNAPIEDLERLGRTFDVDSLYAAVEDGPLGEFLRRPGWAWRGRGPWGPFGSEEGGWFRKGLLPTHALLDRTVSLLLPTWDSADPADLVLAATWGLTDKCEARGKCVPYQDLLAAEAAAQAVVGPLAAGLLHVETAQLNHRELESGVVVLRPGHPEDVVAFWNLRAYGDRVIGVPADGHSLLVRSLLAPALPGITLHRSGADEPEPTLDVSGLEYASAEVAKLITAAADRDGLVIRATRRESVPLLLFQGQGTRFTRSIRADFRPESLWVDVDLPALPLVEDPNSFKLARGVVAAEVTFREVHGQDPRLTTELPPYRRHSALVEGLGLGEGVEHVRVGYNGLVLGLDAGREDARVPFAQNIDVIRYLFDDDSAMVTQSDVGRFQTRASEKFGGPFGGMFTQPGVRAAVMLAAGKPAGITLPHLRSVVEKERGGWPHASMESGVSPRDYAIRWVNNLFNSGLFIPTLKVHCSHCRVESHVSADQLTSTMQCEFCGRSYNLALSHGLARPDWRYRLAAHLRADQVGALLPALATTSLLRQLRPSHDLPPLGLGLRVTLGGREVEVDVAAYLMDPDWVAVLGEVKTGNRIDAHDVENFEFLRNRLTLKDVRCALLFATLKEQFSPEEKNLLRELVSRSAWIETSSGTMVPNVPLVLTGPDLSRHFWDEEHPWRWDKRTHSGIFGTAMTSCERNLGLRGFKHNGGAADHSDFVFEWGSD